MGRDRLLGLAITFPPWPMEPTMTDYRDDKRAERRAHKYRWVVYGVLPFLFLLAILLTFHNELVFFYYTRIFQ